MAGVLLPYVQGIWAAQTSANMRSASHAPASNTQATCTITAPGAGYSVLVRTVSASLLAGAGVGTGTVELTDGTTVFWRYFLVAAATIGDSVALPIDYVFAANVAPILRFTAASGVGTSQVVSMTGVVIPSA